MPVVLCTAYDTFKEDMKSIAADFYVIKSFDKPASANLAFDVRPECALICVDCRCLHQMYALLHCTYNACRACPSGCYSLIETLLGACSDCTSSVMYPLCCHVSMDDVIIRD